MGAIDGSYIPIIALPQFLTNYFNSKGWHSIILKGVVDRKGQFWNVFAGLPEKIHNVILVSTLWERAGQSNLIPPHHRDIDPVFPGYHILEDSAYPQKNCLIKTFTDTGRLTDEHQRFKQQVNKVKVVVDHAEREMELPFKVK